MKRTILTIVAIICFIGISNAQQFQPENINRGLVAVTLEGNDVYVGWRLLATDPDSIAFNVYRGETLITVEPLKESTNLVDTDGTGSDVYTVVPVLGGEEQEGSEQVMPWGQNYLTVPLQRPAGGTTPGFNCTASNGTLDYPDGQDYSYSPNDASTADLDGDGEYEIILKWDPSNSHDNAHCGYTGNTYLDGLEMDGTLLWRIDLGVNVRSGAHYSPFMVYDLDGDGAAEVVCRTASGTKDGTGAFISDGPSASADTNADYRNGAGYILSGPEFLTVFNGPDGSERVTTALEPARGSVSDWGDSYGNRVDRFLAAVAYLGGENPSVVWCRGIYTKVELAAWDLVEDELVPRWHFKSQEGYPNWAGMGSHNLSVGDVDGDNKDEIVYGHCAIDDDGTGLWTLRPITGPMTGDAMHLADIVPERPGLEKWGCGEGTSNPRSMLVDAATGEVLWKSENGDQGRATAGDLSPDFLGMEVWGGTDGLRSADNERVGGTPSSTNHVVWWDGDLGRELLDATNIRKYDPNTTLLLANGCSSNNGTKSNPCLQADIFGDWREEVIWRTSDNNNLRIYTTTDVTPYRITTLMHDPQYRLAVAWQNDSYNQPPHTSFYLGYEMFLPDSLWPPSKPRNLRSEDSADSVRLVWDAVTNPDLAGYRIFRGLSQDSLVLLEEIGLNTTYLDTNVVNDSTYYYAVAAYDMDNNQSAFSDIVSGTPTIRPDTPGGVDYRYDANSVLLFWDSQDFAHITKVNIYRFISVLTGFVLLESVDKSQTTYTISNLNTGVNYSYQITVTDTSGKESFPTETISVTPQASYTVQAEDANYIGSVNVDSNHEGYNGTAFINFDPNNSGLEFTHVPGYGGGDRTLILRYALGNDNRTGLLTVNGNSQSLTMTRTDDGLWTTWTLDSVGIYLNAGYDNTLRIETTGNDFGNLDEITIIPLSITAIANEGNSAIPTQFELQQNYPNPFNPQTTISFGLPKAAAVHIQIFNIRGQLVSDLVDDNYQAGYHKVLFNGAHLASGLYFVRSEMISKDGENSRHVFTKKIILMK